MRLHPLSVASVAITLLALFFPIGMFGQGAQYDQTPLRKIPRGFKTYELFLVCNPHWLNADKAKDFDELRKQFEDFGKAIGDDNLAVWFWKRNGGRTGEDIDLNRSISYCRSWGLPPSQGPYLVVLQQYPDQTKEPPHTGVFALGNMQIAETARLLDSLGDDLLKYDRLTEHPKPPTVPRDDADKPFWVRMLYAVQQTASHLGCGWTFELSSGPTKTKWEPCKEAK